MMEIETTANQKYQFKTEYFNKPLSKWIEICHRHMSLKSGWGFQPLLPGTFGYDNQAMSIGHLFDNYNSKLTVEGTAALIHEGWVINYLFWRDNSPWLRDKRYKKPSKPLNDKRRNHCAATEYSELPKDEQDKDVMLAECILSNLDHHADEYIDCIYMTEEDRERFANVPHEYLIEQPIKIVNGYLVGGSLK
jgi:hypothetical protein